ncbi:hypothetical protein [Williamsia sp. CHRR-6]|uniref:hypothetical protein n=1 Tax=Williamsia sp. CHRR-6 TaxID=2835871 RepID=UPI001BD95742|nr:hypothetical protein [Williamsia sp. CHRR-6]MBT0566769.1 hypothetical protein [Williamsia sp. CHRR-6]
MADNQAPRSSEISPVRMVFALLGLAVGLWGLLGAPDIGGSDIVRWGAVAAAAVVGIGLIVAGGLRSRDDQQ